MDSEDEVAFLEQEISATSSSFPATNQALDQESESIPLLAQKINTNGSSFPTTSQTLDQKTESRRQVKPTGSNFSTKRQALNEKPTGNEKKKKPPFLERQVVVTNPKHIDDITLLQTLHKRYTTAYKKWVKNAKVFKLSHLFVTVIVVLVQLAQVIVFQLPEVSNPVKHALATILPGITGAVLAIQLKLGWSEKGVKCKKTAKLYKVLASCAEYRLQMFESGGDIEAEDTVKMWNTAMLSEIKEVPAFISPF